MCGGEGCAGAKGVEDCLAERRSALCALFGTCGVIDAKPLIIHKVVYRAFGHYYTDCN